MASLTSMSDVLNVYGVTAIQVIQENLSRQENSLFRLSMVFDPRYAFTIFCPLLFSIKCSFGLTLIWTITVTEWFNQILKWVLMSDRPYWWVHETDVYNRTGIPVPVIKQFPLTCETGPGSPSGHAMATASVWFILIHSFFLWYKDHGFPVRRLLQLTIWTLYGGLLFAVSVSRLYIAAHFPHQCLLGIVIGIIVAKTIWEIPINHIRFSTYLTLTVVMFVTVVGTYSVMTLLGVNPSRSVAKAVKYCVNKEWVHLDTTPFFSIMRYTGFFFGSGVAVLLNSRRGCYQDAKPNAKSATLLNKVVLSSLSVLSCKLITDFKIPSENMRFFHATAFAMNVLLPVMFITLIPRIVDSVLPPSLPPSDSKREKQLN